MLQTGSQVSDLNHVFSLFLDTLVLACALPFSVSYEKADEVMKLESLLSTLWVLGGTSLATRLMTQSVELALAATAVEWSARRIKVLRQLVCATR